MIGLLFDVEIFFYRFNSFIMDESSSSSSLVSVNSPTTFPFFKWNFLDKDTGIYIIEINLISKFYLDLNEIPIWNHDIGILLSYLLQQRANHDDIFGRYNHNY